MTTTATKTLDRSHIAAIVRHLIPANISLKAPHTQATIRFRSESDARTAIELLKARGYYAGFFTAVTIIVEAA